MYISGYFLLFLGRFWSDFRLQNFEIFIKILFFSQNRKRLPGQRSTSRIHQINIVQNALEALKQARPDINMVGINPSDIVDGKASVVLGLIWRMVLNFQVQL